MASKKQGKNANYQTAKTQEKMIREAQKEEARAKHRLGAVKTKLRMKTTQLICLIIAVLLVLSSGGTAVYALITSSASSKTAADYTYPPLLLYDGTYYMATSEQVYETLEGESITAVVTGDQNTYPVSDGSCNFGKKSVPFLLVDGTVYCCIDDGSYLKFTEFSSSADDTEE